MSAPALLCSPSSVMPRAPLALRPLALAVHMLAAGVVFVAPCVHAAQQTEQTETGSSVTLAPIAITETAVRERSAVTEDTHSYTTDAARTATPLSMSLRETPQSVSVITQQRIQDQDLKNHPRRGKQCHRRVGQPL